MLTIFSTVTRFLAFDIVHAVEFSRIGRSRRSAFRQPFGATFLPYHFVMLCQIRFRVSELFSQTYEWGI